MPSSVTHQGGLQGSRWFLQQLRALLFDFSQPFSIVLQGKRHGGARLLPDNSGDLGSHPSSYLVC